MDLSIIIVNYNVYDDVVKCIKAVYETVHGLQYEILVVDNDSPEKSISQINTLFPDVIIFMLDKNIGFGAANNIAMKKASGKFILFLNPDILVEENTINELYKTLNEDKTTSVVGPVFKKPNRENEYYYTFFPSLYSRIMQEFGLHFRTKKMKKRVYDFMNNSIQKKIPFMVDWVLGACMMVKSDVYKTLGGFDEAFFLFEEETEWQYRMRNVGWHSKIVPQAVVIHNHHTSVSKFGKLFVNYHEYRSRIIFSAKQFKFPLICLRKQLILCSIIFHFIFFSIFDFNSFKITFKRAYLYFDLINLVLMSKKRLLKKRFMFDLYSKYFIGMSYARF